MGNNNSSYDSLKDIYDKCKINPVYIKYYIPYENEILDMFNNNNINTYLNTDKGELLVWIAIYYMDVENNVDKAIEYYLKAIDKGNTMAMCSLGRYYLFESFDSNISKSYILLKDQKIHDQMLFNKALDYFTMAANKKNIIAIRNLMFIYSALLNDYDTAKIYGKMMLDEINQMKLEKMAIDERNKMKLDEII